MNTGFHSEKFLSSLTKLLGFPEFRIGVETDLGNRSVDIIKSAEKGERLSDEDREILIDAATESFLENSKTVISFHWDGDFPGSAGGIRISRIGDIYMLHDFSMDIDPEGPFTSIDEALNTEYFDFQSGSLTGLDSDVLPETTLVEIAKGIFDWENGVDVLINSERYIPEGKGSYPAKRKLVKYRDPNDGTIEVDSTLFEIEERDGSLALCYKGQPIRFENGEVAKHSDGSFWEHVIDEFQSFGLIKIDKDQRYLEPLCISSFKLLEHQRCVIEKDNFEFIEKFRDCIARDEIIRPCAGPEAIDQYARYAPVTKYLKELGVTLPNHPQSELKSHNADDVFTEPEEKRFVEALEDAFLSFSSEEKAVTHFLFSGHHEALLFPMVLAKQRCTPIEYANGIMAAECILSGVFCDVGVGDHRGYSLDLNRDAQVALDFVRLSNPDASEISKGETETREFKSTFQVNLFTGKKDNKMIHACLKTVAAFLNSKGGDLYIGVKDDGSIQGIESDGFKNTDKFLLCLTDSIDDHIGKVFSQYWDTLFVEYGNKTVCKVTVSKSNEPAFLGKEEELFIRTGPSSKKLTHKEAYKYMSSHFEQ